MNVLPRFVDYLRRDRRPIAGDARHVDRRLADVGLVEPLLRPDKAQRRQVEPHDLVRRLERPPRRRRRLEKVLAHPYGLSALTRTEDANFLSHLVLKSGMGYQPMI